MSASVAPTEIVNLTLDLIKTENINDITIPDDDKISAVCARWWDDTRQECQEGFPWVFSSTRAAIPLNATAPDFGFTDAYVLPNGYLSLNFINYQHIPLSQWNYTIEDGNIHIDNGKAERLNIGYVFDQTDVSKWSPSFKFFVAASFGEKVAYKLTGNAGLQKRMSEAKQREQINAQAKNGKVNPPIAYRQSRMLNARRIFGGAARSPLGRPHGRA